MRKRIAKLAFEFRWWKWFLWDGPNMCSLILNGVDKQSRRIIYGRHAEREPQGPV